MTTGGHDRPADQLGHQLAPIEARQEREALPWDRLQGETAKQFAAFEVFRQLDASERTVREVMRRQNLRSPRKLYSWCTMNHWRARALAWDEHQAREQQRVAKQALVEMSEAHTRTLQYTQAIVNMHLERVVAQVRQQLEGDPGAVPDYLNARELIRWVHESQHLEAAARNRTLELSGPHGLAGAVASGFAHQQQTNTLEAWRAAYIEPERTFLPHQKQRLLIHSAARFCCAVAGVQSGKTSGTAIAFHKRIQDDAPRLRAKGEAGFYWLIAPNSLVGEVMCEAFESYAPPGMIEGRKGRGSGMTWTLTDGTRVQFRSAEKADTLVARRLHGAWCDEFTLLKRDVWVTSVRQRLVTTNGWCLFSGTPRGKNWAYDEIWRRADQDDDRHDPDYEGFTWWSEENPQISQSEIEAAERQLPAAYFKREYRASWESFHGQIYEDWNHDTMVVRGLRRQLPPFATKVCMGIDWGFGAPGAVVVGRKLPTGAWHVVEEVQRAGKLPSWWNDEIARMWEEHRVTEIYADPEDAGRIAELRALGLPIVPANNAVHQGIRHVASLIKQGLFAVDKGCPLTAKHLESYHWATDSQGNQREHPVKENDHLPDACRYMTYSEDTVTFEVTQSGYGSAKD